MTKLVVWIFVLNLSQSYGFYFDGQPRILASDGNLIVEAAKDRNITFRLQGVSSLNVNDRNIFDVMAGTDHQTSPGNVNNRITVVEDSINDLKSREQSYAGRIIRLENGTRPGVAISPAVNNRLRNLQRRLTRIETKVERLMSILSEDNCRSNPCQNGGTCVDIFDGFICKCPLNWEGSTCSVDVNECAMYAGTELGCQNGASCINTPGSYSCSCTSGWQGIHCTRRGADCLSSGAELCGHGSCISTSDSIGYKCICDQGWKTNGVNLACTVDIDECSEMKPYCSMDPVVQCINIPGSFMCGLCPAGFSGNGHYCSDINECETNNGGCSTAPTVNCINTRGSHHCGPCPAGWQGDGKYCVRPIPSDGRNTGACVGQNFCHSAATCVESFGRATCNCPTGYVGSGIGPLGCFPGTAILHPCSVNPCQNGGSCLPNGTLYTCICPAGTTPPLCASAFNPCNPSPCRNGGTCTRLRGMNYRCTCPPAFVGNQCENERSECGGVLNSESGTLKYPLSSPYPHNTRCAWLIKTNITQVLNVTFSKFLLEASSECRFDWLQIHDGRSSSSQMIGRFCGTNAPKGGHIVSTGNMLYLWFRSDNTSTHDGFELAWESIDPLCGGVFEITSHGTVSSPGSPGNYPSNRDCEWALIAPSGKRIQFQFFTMQIERHENCQYDYVSIYSGTSATSGVLLSKFCNTSHPEPLTTPYNEAMIQFHSDESGTDAGFQIHYTVIEGVPGCGGIFTASVGEFSAPTHHGTYQKNMLCEYLIRMPKDSRIQIKFLQFQLEDSSQCDFDYVEIFEGGTDKDPKVSRYCGSETPPDYTSLGNVLLVVFKSDWSANYEGFKMSYEIVCGGLFENETDTILSPFYPNQYEHSRTCHYEILAQPGKAITLHFEDFDIEDTSYPDCDFDFVQIFDGFNTNATQIGKYCGATIPPNSISTLNAMFIVFQSDASISSRGFKATYSFIDIKCGGVVKSLGHEIKPPKQTNNILSYEYDANCTWILVAPIGFIVQLTFYTFHLEQSSDCSLDFVSLYEGTITNGTKIQTYCGANLPPVIQSNENVLSLNFVSDSSISGEGFTATYTFIDSKRVCGGTYYSPSGIIRSPGWPANYLESKDCVFIINAPTGQQIQLAVKSFELEDNDNCLFDYLQIRNGGTMQSPVIGKYCGTNIPKLIRSYTNQMHIQFKSDSSRDFKGFEIEWDATLTGCGGNINNLVRGSIISPNYPSPYGVNTQCDWRIAVSKGSTIQLLFSDLELEEHSECYFDYLEIFDGRSTAAKSLGRYCTLSNAPSHILSTTNEIFLRLVTDVNNQGRGFDLKFSTICTLEIKKHRGVIESPNFPNKYPNSFQCEWTLIAPPGNKIYVAFSQFELESNEGTFDSTTDCSFDYLQIIQKKSDDKDITDTQTYCARMPEEFTSIGNTIVFKFKTDATTAAGGFHLEYEVQGCGGEFTRPSGNFTTPNYPNAYPHGVSCEWSITTDYGNIIELTIVDFDIESTPGCYDSLTISNQKNNSHHLNVFCTRFSKPVTVTSDGNEFYVKFVTDMSYTGKGFSAYYTTKPAQCGGLFKIRQSAFTSPKYPSNYASDLYCEWFLEVEENHGVSLSFDDFSTENSCEHDSVKIYDGFEKMTDKLMTTLCGNEIPKTIYNSTGNKMLVVMQTDGSIEAKGFSAAFKTACGGILSANESGMIDMNSYTGHNGYCNWTIVAPRSEQHVTLTIVSLQALSQMSLTCFLRILVYDGYNTEAPLTKDFCAQNHPPPIISSGNSLTLSVIENESFSGFVFKAYYSTLENICGGKFSDKMGQIASPSYPKSYPLDVECVWELMASPGNRLILTFEKFDIEESEHCNEDYLEVRESSVQGKLIGVYCGKNVPSNLPQAEKFWLKFKSNSDGVGEGFLAQYAYATHVEIDGSSGVITSPLYPQILPHVSTIYSYRITVKYGYFISLVTKEILSKSGHSISVYDGYDENAPAEEILDINSNPILSSSNVLLIAMGSEYYSEVLFKFEWNEVSQKPKQMDNGTQTTNCTKNSIVYVNNETSVNISSPGYPYGYGTNENCTWILKPDQMGFHASFRFLEIDLEDTTNCLADYVEVSSSKDLSEYKVLNRTCQVNPNTNPNTVLAIHGAPYLKLQFVSDYYTNRTGFIGSAKALCGAPMSGPSGVLTVDKETSCEWEITVRRGRTIKFEFLKFDIPIQTIGKCRNYVLIKNGNRMDSPFVGQGVFCGTSIPIVGQTSSNHALVVFKEDTINTFSSFTLRYEEVNFDCGGTIIFNEQNSTIINTPNYPNIPTPHIECIWTIIVPNGELIKVDFIQQFDITPSTNCEEEYVEIRDGGTSNGLLIGKFCGKMPETQYSVSNMLRIKYYTDISVPMNGFRVNVSLAKCGGFYRSPNGFIQSNHYPGVGNYDKNSICEYHVIGSDGSSINLTFLDLHLPSAENCSDTDHIEIFSIVPKEAFSNDTTFDEIGRYCGSDGKPEPIITSSEVLVRFVTKQANSQYRGFRMSYNSSIEKCGGEIASDSGYLTSPGYPNGHPFRQYCEWRLNVPTGRRVRVDILDFDFGETIVFPNTRYYAVARSQSLAFYNDFVYTSRIKRVGQNETSEPVYSSGNRMMITLWMRYNAGHRGFKLRFSSDEPSICIGDLNQDEGVIESPKNVSSYYCEYQRDQTKPFISGTNSIGTMGIYIVENASSAPFCTMISPITVQYSPTTRNQFFTRYCNTTYTSAIASPFREIKIGAKKGGYHSEVGTFTINYKIHNCGQLISNTQEITIRNPQFPANYGRIACGWQFKTIDNAPVMISGSYGNLDCATEYINLYYSPFPIQSGKKRLCGQSVSQLTNFTSTRSSSIFIEYHSTNYNPNTTFEFNIKSNYSVCGGSIEQPIFEFSNPLNGSQYPNNIECVWDISTSIGYHIGLSFINRYYIETSENCTKDYIEIYDFADDDWKLLSRVCGRSIPGPFNSTGTQMRIIFRTNENIVGEGFTIKWDENCGGVFSVLKKQQMLTSPKYPNKYPRNLKCNYTLIAGKEDFINVDFNEFELEETSRSCVYDNLTIYNYVDWSYPSGSPTLVGVYCWKNSLNHIRHKHKINLIFSSDSYIERKGFSSRYYLDNCGGNVTNSSMIEVPQKETGKYADYLTCLWYIKAAANQKIVIRFEYFELEHNDGCYLDSVEVFQGLQTDLANRKAQLCGNLTQHAPVINIDSNNAVVKFHSDATNGERGFSALILLTEKCDKSIELNDKSPSYKLDNVVTFYSSNLDCHYVITVPEGYVLKVEFEHFHLATCHNDNTSCTCDYLSIFDGSDAFAEVIQKNLCGHSVPRTITSSGRSLFIRYVTASCQHETEANADKPLIYSMKITDSVLSSSGFSANIRMEAAECGLTFIRMNATNPEHTLSWPQNGGSYRPNSRCDWTIQVPDFEQINLHFEKFDLQDADSASQCGFDYLQVTDLAATLLNSEGLGSEFTFSGGKQRVLRPYFYWGRSFPAAPHIYCGRGIPDDLVSSSKTIQVRFRSDDSIEKAGFRIVARMSPACHRNYTSLQGRMFAKTLNDCETYITVPENYTISLYFSIFNIYLSDYSFQCTSENSPMKIFDHRNNRLIQHICPGSVPNPIFANTSSLLIKSKKMNVSWADTNGAYDITYLASDKGLGCGGQIFNYAGQFSSPMYPLNDRNASDCRWDITVPQNLVVSITFSVFDMGSKVTCTDNYIQIIETDIEGKETVARQYCGEDVPSSYKGIRNILTIKFKKTANFAGTGWNIQFMSVHPTAILS